MQASAQLTEGSQRKAPLAGGWSPRRAIGLIILANLLLGVALFLLRPPWSTPPEPEAALPELPAQVRDLQARLGGGHAGEPYSLVLTDDELTAAAAYYVATTPDVPFSRVRASVSGEKVTVDAVTKGLAVAAPVRVVATASASGGVPRAHVENVSLGDTPLPGFIRDRVVQDANASLDFSRKELPVTVEAIELRPGTLIIRGRLK